MKTNTSLLISAPRTSQPDTAATNHTADRFGAWLRQAPATLGDDEPTATVQVTLDPIGWMQLAEAAAKAGTSIDEQVSECARLGLEHWQDKQPQ